LGAPLDLDDEALFALAKKGDRAALASVIKRNEAELLRRIRARMNRSLRATVDPSDILQETAIVALHSLSRTSSSRADELLPWIAGIAANRVRRLARSLRPRVRPRRDSSLPRSFLVQVPNGVLESLWASDAGVEARDPCAWLRGLRPDQKLILVLRDRLGLTWGTVAFVMDRRIDASRMLRLRAARRLQTCMPDECSQQVKELMPFLSPTQP
jgi:DNA-directed RNA polymerase specialized sigma24 family protein